MEKDGLATLHVAGDKSRHRRLRELILHLVMNSTVTQWQYNHVVGGGELHLGMRLEGETAAWAREMLPLSVDP